MFRLFTAAALLTLALGACEAAGSDEPSDPRATEAASGSSASSQMPDRAIESGVSPMPESGEADDSGCGADKLGRWLNVLPTDEMKAQISATVGERPIRYYTQGDPITLDFSPARLNVELGKDGRIKLFRCG